MSTLRGKRGTYGAGRWLWWRAWFPFGAVGAAAVGVAGVALGGIDGHFAWQAWHLATWIATLRGRRGAWRHRPPLCVAGVALTALGWLWWRAWFPFGAVGAAAVCVAGVALVHTQLTLTQLVSHATCSQIYVHLSP